MRCSRKPEFAFITPQQNLKNNLRKTAASTENADRIIFILSHNQTSDSECNTNCTSEETYCDINANGRPYLERANRVSVFLGVLSYMLQNR